MRTRTGSCVSNDKDSSKYSLVHLWQQKAISSYEEYTLYKAYADKMVGFPPW